MHRRDGGQRQRPRVESSELAIEAWEKPVSPMSTSFAAWRRSLQSGWRRIIHSIPLDQCCQFASRRFRHEIFASDRLSIVVVVSLHSIGICAAEENPKFKSHLQASRGERFTTQRLRDCSIVFFAAETNRRQRKIAEHPGFTARSPVSFKLLNMRKTDTVCAALPPGCRQNANCFSGAKNKCIRTAINFVKLRSSEGQWFL